MENQYLIILNDFRSFPITSALSIAKLHGKKNVSFIYSKKYIGANEYGQNLPGWYKIFKIFFIKLFYKVVVVPESLDESLTTSMTVGVNSSLQSITLDSGATLEKYPVLYNHLKQQAIGSNEIANYICELKAKPNCVYLFNGRTASSSSITLKLHHAKIGLKYYEFSSKTNGYLLFPFPCHNSLRIGSELFNLWKWSIKSNPILFKNGCDFQKNKLTNFFTSYYSEAVLGHYDIVVFLGSDHEYTNLQLEIVQMHVIGNLELLEYVVNKYGFDKKVAVRAHPNQSNDPNRDTLLKPIMDKCDKYGFYFFDPESRISSYDLINNSELVVVEYSSIAYDAIFLGAKVDIVGDIAIKSIIKMLPENIIKDGLEIKYFAREILSLGEDLCFNKFTNNIYSLSARSLALIERKFLN